MNYQILVNLIKTYLLLYNSQEIKKPLIVINTWPFVNATDAAWDILNPSTTNNEPGSAIDAVVAACSQAEEDVTIKSVGYGCSPDENGNTTLDAMVMDGETMNVGAVASMPHIRQASKVAREVLQTTKVTLLVGSAAEDFAVSRGFERSILETETSLNQWKDWKDSSCQPNFRKHSAWIPDPSKACGPYKSKRTNFTPRTYVEVDENNHDTIGVIALDAFGSMAVGTSTSGSTFKIPGRVGDSPIPGAGGYVINEVGGAVATGDGDIMMRFLLSYQVVESMRQGIGPTEACKRAILTVKSPVKWYGALVALTKNGEYGSACIGFKNFQYSVRASWLKNETQVVTVSCM